MVQVQKATLGSGDYSISGLTDRVAVERKSLEDLYSTLTFGRDRFVRELQRLASFDYSAVVVEASLEAIISRPPPYTDISPKSIYRSILAFSQRYPSTHWFTLDSRRLAEVTTYRILERFWVDEESGLRQGMTQPEGMTTNADDGNREAESIGLG